MSLDTVDFEREDQKKETHLNNDKYVVTSSSVFR